MISFHNKEPLELHGEGIYNFDVVKELRITNDLLKLPLNIRACQNMEAIGNCPTRILKDKMLNVCGCLPFRIRVGNQVNTCYKTAFFSFYSLIHWLQTLCSPDQLGCIQKIKDNIKKEDFLSCAPSCKGLLVSSFSKTEANSDEHKVRRTIMFM